MKILISGVSGFLGRHLRALCDGHETVGLTTSAHPSGTSGLWRFDALASLDFQPDAVIHCHAAVVSGKTQLDQNALYEGNVHATKKLVSRFPEARHVYAATVSVYGNNFGKADETTPPAPANAYAQSKLDGEAVVAAAKNYAIVRFSSLYGPGMKDDTLIPNYTNQALQGQIQVWGDGSRKQSYLAVQDAARLLLQLAEDNAVGIFLGTARQTYSNLEVAQLLAEETGAEIVFVHQDASLSVDYDPSFTQNTVNWQPQMPLAEGLKTYLSWKKRPY